MHPKNLTPALIEKHGTPRVRRVLGLSSVYYNPGQFPGWSIARDLARGNFLSEKGRAAYLALQPVTADDWGKIAQIEGIPAPGFTAPFATEQIQKLAQRAKLTEVTFDQDTFNTLYACLRLHATSSAATKTGTYPLLDGPPGASKSMIANICAALLHLPVVTVTGSDGSADELKIELFGGDNASSKDIAGIVKDYLYQGWFFHPLSRKLAAIEQQMHPSLDSYRADTLLEIAQHERIKENITAFMPGKYQLAAMHGYLLFLDETNGFKGVTTLLTQMLENYTTDLHPTFFIMGAMNPAGEKHNREPLPPEIRSRFNTIPVVPPSADSYYQMLNYYFTGEQPQIQLLDTLKGRVSPAMLGITIPQREISVLKRCLTPSAFTAFLTNFAKFHKAVELKLEEGVLDPKNGTSGTQETLSIDRRTLTKSIAALDTFIALKQERAIDMVGDVMKWDAYQSMELQNITQALVIEAITETFSLFYVAPFNFAISEEIETDKGTKKEFKSASELVRFLLAFHNLTPEKLVTYLKTTEDLDKLRLLWAARFKESALFEEAQVSSVVQQALELEIQADDKFVQFIRSKVSHKVSVCSLSYLTSAASRKTFIGQEYPQFVLKGSTGTPVHNILDKRLGELSAKKRRYISKEEVGHFSEALKKLSARFVDSPLYIPIYEPESETLGLIVCVPFSVLPSETQATWQAKSPHYKHNAMYAPLRKGKAVENSDDLNSFVTRIAEPMVVKGSELNVDAMKEDIVLEVTVSLL